MANTIDIQAIIKKVANMEAWAAGFQQECQQTRKLLEQADVSTTAKNNSISRIALEARTRLRAKIHKART